MRRGILVVVLVTIAIMLVMAGPAMAKTGTKSGGYWPYSTAIDTNPDNDATTNNADPNHPGFAASLHGHTYVFADAATSPHAGYTNTTGKCKVCHAVHGAGQTNADQSAMLPSEKLLRSTSADACTFCHIGAGAFATDPYVGGPYSSWMNYNGNENTVEFPWGGVDVARSGHFRQHGHDNPQGVGLADKSYQGCVSCHTVHGANAITDNGSKPNILKNDPAKDVVSQAATGWGSAFGLPNTGYGSHYDAVNNQTEFCEDCHDGTKLVNGTTQVKEIVSQADFNTYFPSCGWRNDRAFPTVPSGLCHNSVSTTVTESVAQFGAFNNKMHNGRSHIMTASDRFNDTAISAETVYDTSCRTCHDIREQNWPHFGVNNDGATLNNQMVSGFDEVQETDKPCLKCHGTVGTEY